MCDVSRCREEGGNYIYYSHSICQRHWVEHCEGIINLKDLLNIKTEETNMSKKQIAKAVEQEEKPAPEKESKTLYVPCSVCKKKMFTRPDVYQKRIEKFGSEEKMLSEYKCRECRK